MASRPRHPNKEIEAAVKYALSKGWSWTKAKGHGWGILRCAFGERGGCQRLVWSTPKHPQDHAKDIRRFVDRCLHRAT